MGIVDTVFEVEQVFVNALGEYYLALTRKAPEDSHIPSPSPMLVTMLAGARDTMGIPAVGIQVAQDVVASASINTNITNVSGAGTEPAIPMEVTAPAEVTTENPAQVPTTETTNLNP